MITGPCPGEEADIDVDDGGDFWASRFKADSIRRRHLLCDNCDKSFEQVET